MKTPTGTPVKYPNDIFSSYTIGKWDDRRGKFEWVYAEALELMARRVAFFDMPLNVNVSARKVDGNYYAYMSPINAYRINNRIVDLSEFLTFEKIKIDEHPHSLERRSR
jgi:hypothetical protein